MAQIPVRPSNADLKLMHRLVQDMLYEKQRQGDYNADSPSIRLALSALNMLFKHEFNKGKSGGKVPRRRPSQAGRNQRTRGSHNPHR